MTTTTMTILLQVGALMHAGLLCAGASMPKAVGLKNHLAGVPPFIRRLLYVYLSFIGLILLGFGLLTFCFAERMATGEPIARGVCLLMLAFWVARLIVAAFVFDVRPYLTTFLYRLGYQATNAVFIYLVVVYLLVLWRGGPG